MSEHALIRTKPKARTRGVARSWCRSDGGALRRQLLGGDVLACAVGWLPTATARLALGGPTRAAVTLASATISTLLVLRLGGLYRSRVCAQAVTARARFAFAVLAGLGAAVAVQGTSDLRQPGQVALGAASTLALLLLGRWRFDRWLRQKHAEGRFLRTVILVGTNPHAASVMELLGSEPELGYRVGGVVAADRPEGRWAGVPTTEPGGLPALARRVGASGVLIVGGAVEEDETSKIIQTAIESGLHVQVWPGVAGLSSSRVRMSPVSGLPVLYVEPHRTHTWQAALKRTMDVVLSAILLVVFALPMAVIAATVKREDGGKVLYRSLRVGRGGEIITVTKFRTMTEGAEKMIGQLAELNERRGGPLFKAGVDPRVTGVGRFLRATSLDELPQLWDVLQGRMSLVGPRPALPSEVEQFDPELRRRHEVRPGITGLWQVEARDNPSFRAYRRLDLAYVDNWTPWLDLMILATTAHAVTVRGLRVLRTGLRRTA